MQKRSAATNPHSVGAIAMALFLSLLLPAFASATMAATEIGELTLRQQSRLGLRPLAGLGEELSRPGTWRRSEPEPQGRFDLEEKPSEGPGLVGAIWRTALLPGWGQRYLGAPGRGLVFMGAEAATWGTWSTFKIQQSLRRDDYIELAQVFAGVSSTDHDDSYWKYVGQHANWLDFNQWLRYEARREYGFGTDAYDTFIEENEVTEADGWDWNSFDRQLSFLQKRKGSKSAERRATYTLYALLVNRVVSVIDTILLHRSREEIRETLDREQAGLGFQALPGESGLTYRVGWYSGF